ncbi:VWA domain-containing protein [Bosea sp. (in: a-proteobacteria)]|uniref:VWA domain-containing protein n=1 Tax=Bosea sp. (in: a-proteobacteria) TaxID=1871050 RepID=UPI00261F88EA|nr:VWA domain-containing protein [Bosea sp. (in: a-proteobacteria)]MCO5093045.1 VWA domain-containing protein [Bosea sp. (in: a-proteobacteria)]
MSDRNERAVGKAGATAAAGPSEPGEIDRFLGAAKRLAPLATGQAGRLVFALDATMSRQPTWDLACSLQARMFDVAAGSGGLAVQLVYFRGLGECRASGWVGEPARLNGLMRRIACAGGQTQIARVLRHVRDEASAVPLRAFVYVGDAMEEDIDALAALAGELGLRGIRGFVFQEGDDPAAGSAFATIARLTGGAHARFDSGAPDSLLDLLRGAAAYAAGGREAMQRLSGSNPAVKGLIAAMDGGRR